MSRYYIGFDCGTMGTKVAIFSEDSTLVADAYRPHKIDYPKPGWAEMDPDQYYRVVTEGIKECMDKSKINPKDVRAISCSGIVCGFVPIDDNWNPVGPYFPYLDTRSREEVKYVSENVEPLWEKENGNSIIGAFIPPMIMKWLLKNRKDMIKKTKKIVTGCHYVMGKLGGLKTKDAYIDWAHLSGWVLGFDGRKRDWSPRQLELLEIPIELLPKVKKPWDIVGSLTKKEAELTGLAEGIPLVAGAGDMQQSCIGSGIVDLGVCSDVAGTASNFNITVDDFKKEITAKKTFMYAMDTMGDYYLAWSVIPGGGLSLRWFRDELMGKKGDENFYEEMDRMAENVPIGSKYSLFLPFLQGRTNPVWSNASAGWLGLYASNDSASLWRSMLESIAFEYLSWMNVLREVGVKPIKIVGQGGGSKGNIWNQIKADILNIPYLTLKRSEQAVLGDALLAAYGVGDVKNFQKTAREWAEIKETFMPDRENNSIYMKIYKQREKIINGPIKETFDMLAELHEIDIPEKKK